MHSKQEFDTRGIHALAIKNKYEDELQRIDSANREIIEGLPLKALAIAVRLARIVIEADYLACAKYRYLRLEGSRLAGMIAAFTSDYRLSHIDRMMGIYLEYDEKLSAVIDEIDQAYSFHGTDDASTEACTPHD